MQHLDEGTIHAWLDGELPPDDAESAARHVAGCAECRALVVEARGLLAGASRIASALDAAPAGVVPPAQHGGGATTRRRQWYRFAFTPVRMSIAATIIAAAGLTFTARRVAENSALGEKAADKQFVTVPTFTAPKRAGSPVADSIVALKEMSASGKAKAPAPAPSSARAAASADLSSTKPSASSKPQVTDAAGFEKKTAHLDRRAVTNSPRHVAAAPAAAPAAEPAPPVRQLDSTRAKDELVKVSADSLRRGDALERRRAAFVAGGVNQMQGSVLTERDATGSRVFTFRDCYRLAVDSTEWRGVLPSGFALDARETALNGAVPAAASFTPSRGGVAGGVGGARGGAASGAAQPTASSIPAAAPAPAVNSVRALDSNGRVGPTAIGLWFLGHADTIGVRLSRSDSSHKLVTLLMTGSGSSARVIAGDRADSVRVARVSCPR